MSQIEGVTYRRNRLLVRKARSLSSSLEGLRRAMSRVWSVHSYSFLGHHLEEDSQEGEGQEEEEEEFLLRILQMGRPDQCQGTPHDVLHPQCCIPPAASLPSLTSHMGLPVATSTCALNMHFSSSTPQTPHSPPVWSCSHVQSPHTQRAAHLRQNWVWNVWLGVTCCSWVCVAEHCPCRPCCTGFPNSQQAVQECRHSAKEMLWR